jgi:Tfp pilus assembly protein PilZ
MRHPVLNLSEGGLFLLTDQPLAVGRELALELPLAERTIHVSGKVVHATATEEWAGNGIQLTSLAAADSNALHDFLVAAVTT